MTKTKKKSNGNSFLGTLAALIILCVVLTIVSDKFLTYNNLMSVLKQTTFTALLSTGMLLCNVHSVQPGDVISHQTYLSPNSGIRQTGTPVPAKHAVCLSQIRKTSHGI